MCSLERGDAPHQDCAIEPGKGAKEQPELESEDAAWLAKKRANKTPQPRGSAGKMIKELLSKQEEENAKERIDRRERQLQIMKG